MTIRTREGVATKAKLAAEMIENRRINPSSWPAFHGFAAGMHEIRVPMEKPGKRGLHAAHGLGTETLGIGFGRPLILSYPTRRKSGKN